MTAPPIRPTGIDKSFGPVQAHRRAEVEVALGERHAPVQDYAAEHHAAEAYRLLWKEVRAELGL